MNTSTRRSTAVGSDDNDRIGFTLSETFRATRASEAKKLTDGTKLSNGVILPWIGYGTYKLGKDNVRKLTLQALQQGYRNIDTAFIYGGETTEREVGLAIQDAVSEGILERKNLVIQTKHWRKFHGYEPTLECLRMSLNRLQLDCLDIWLMHWPGPAWKTMNRRNDEIAKNGPWFYATHSKEDLPVLRGETWRAMEDSVKAGKVKTIGVCNFSIEHLERLKQTATIWPPSINQIECHPLFPQNELLEYCANEGIVVQGYASLGGQDVGKTYWKKLYAKRGKKESVTTMMNSPPVLALAEELDRTPAQVLLRWGLEKNIALIPKSSSIQRMNENANIFDFELSDEQVNRLENELQSAVTRAAVNENETVASMSRLCWRRDPLRNLDFE